MNKKRILGLFIVVALVFAFVGIVYAQNIPSTIVRWEYKMMYGRKFELEESWEFAAVTVDKGGADWVVFKRRLPYIPSTIVRWDYRVVDGEYLDLDRLGAEGWEIVTSYVVSYNNIFITNILLKIRLP
ncbi:hypothetical protein FACS189445_5660 [Spirochaetia bacterium]|nr:hypothetical protein FACS189445_5660 [Spirochaetia bacterium]